MTRSALRADPYAPMARIVVVDSYDSFTHNLVRYLRRLGADCTVVTNDDPGLDDLAERPPDGIVLSPGPGSPARAGKVPQLLQRLRHGSTPVLGVCLGHQAIGVAFGAAVGRAPELVHGAASDIRHDGRGIFAGLPQGFAAGRYHSLSVLPDSLPAELELTAWTDSGTVMAVRHRDLPFVGVQFHPESVLTTHGAELLGNWLRLCRPRP